VALTAWPFPARGLPRVPVSRHMTNASVTARASKGKRYATAREVNIEGILD